MAGFLMQGGAWEGEAPADPIILDKPRLGRSLALPNSKFDS